MNLEVKIQKAENGYILTLLNFTGQKRVFQSFSDLMDFLYDYFQEKVKK